MDSSALEIEMSERGHSGARPVRESSQIRAARLLDAWIAGDRERLDFELSQWRDGDLVMRGSPSASSNDDGRDELLLCVVRQMMSEPDLYASRSERIHLGVWMDMLAHLAESENSAR
jgi:hypothetical protein